MIKRPGYDVKLPVQLTQHRSMFETLLGIVIPVLKDILWAACGAMMAYLMNKLTNHFA